MADLVKVDVVSLLKYAEEKLRSIFGTDAEHTECKTAADRILRGAVYDTQSVQVIGMDRPVPIDAIYQPIALKQREDDPSATTLDDLVNPRRQPRNVIVFGGPGRGKSMLVRHAFAALVRQSHCLPLLFTLRFDSAVADLENVVHCLEAGALKTPRDHRVVLLIDGYDEITAPLQRRVETALRKFAALACGTFCLTCRSLYNPSVLGEHYTIQPFSRFQARAFVLCFARAYRAKIDADELLAELEKHRFEDFLDHPLLLTLVCVLKAGPMPALPRTTIALIEKVLSTLVVQWDEHRSVRRQSRIPLDGHKRVKCMAAVAYQMKQPAAPRHLVVAAIQDFLRLHQAPGVDPEALLEEIARWYGVLVPRDLQWTFVHRTIHDYLAAQHWVASGVFDPAANRVWDQRAAYAACRLTDATAAIRSMLLNTVESHLFEECLANGAAFDADVVANAIPDHLLRSRRTWTCERTESRIVASNDTAIFTLASDTLLLALLRAAHPGVTNAHDLILCFALMELHRRGTAIDPQLADAIRRRFRAGRVIEIRRHGVSTEEELDAVLGAVTVARPRKRGRRKSAVVTPT